MYDTVEVDEETNIGHRSILLLALATLLFILFLLQSVYRRNTFRYLFFFSPWVDVGGGGRYYIRDMQLTGNYYLHFRVLMLLRLS